MKVLGNGGKKYKAEQACTRKSASQHVVRVLADTAARAEGFEVP